MTNNDRLLSTSRTLPIALLRARETLMMPIREMLNDIDLTEQKWRILRTLEELGEVEQSTISETACLLLSSLTRTLRSLEKDGFVKRRGDEADRRKTLVQITQRGRDLLSDNIGRSLQTYAEVEEQLGSNKLHQLLDLLDELQNVELSSRSR